MPDISLFNTNSQSYEVFTPLIPGEVSIYHCGPTVYHFQHIGNMRRFIFADLVHRMFVLNGYKVKQVINITDVGHLVSDTDEGEDKMEKGAKREGKTAKEIAEIYSADFFEDLSLLHIRTDHTQFPKATENIPEQIEYIKTLEEKGFVYKTSDGMYFDTAKDPQYGAFARLDIAGLKEGARIQKNPEKKNVTDFALWKFSPVGETRQQEWESPWGIGFPGWHIECSAMVKKFLGNTIDVHTGGIDHISIHHTNEIAQSENANGVPLARYWMHNEHLNFGNEKMAKSGESFIQLKDLVSKGYHPLAFRYFTLVANYRSKINFTFEGLDAATVAWKKLNKFIAKIATVEENVEEKNNETISKYSQEMLSALNDDLDTPKMIAKMWEIIKDNSISESDKKIIILKIDEMIGIIDPVFSVKENLSLDSLPEDIRILVEDRQSAREIKDWKTADEIRTKLEKMGYEINDEGAGFSIKKS